MRRLSRQQLEEIVLFSFCTEVNALKPGNVSPYSEGHDMTVDDFIRSAELVTPILCDSSLSLGERIYQAVDTTHARVGCNTNLGMVLLFAPLIMAAERSVPGLLPELQEKSRFVVRNSTREDAKMVFQAIVKAAPGGLGQGGDYDVHLSPACSLVEAMDLAKERDSIAKQYVTAFTDIFASGLETIKGFTRRWNRVEWAAVACYLNFLSTLTDSHIGRKSGYKLADQIKPKARTVFERLINNKNPEDAVSILLEFDRELKDANLNPGTSADLTAASILVYKLGMQ